MGFSGRKICRRRQIKFPLRTNDYNNDNTDNKNPTIIMIIKIIINYRLKPLDGIRAKKDEKNIGFRWELWK